MTVPVATIGTESTAAGESRIARWLIDAYPQMISEVRDSRICWCDGTSMALGGVDRSERTIDSMSALTCVSVADQFRWEYPAGLVGQKPVRGDPGRLRYTPFFDKMYGATRTEVEANLVPVRWLPTSSRKTLLVTRINGVAGKLAQVSAELDALPESFKKFLLKPGGAFNWRPMEGSQQISPHAYGIAIDINAGFGDYWRWDLEKTGQIGYQNRIPAEIVAIFERHGFIWGGKWEHYDTMHFEYRPELLLQSNSKVNSENVLYLAKGGEAYGSERQLAYLVKGLNPSRYTPVILRQDQGAERDEPFPASPRFPLRPWRKVANILTRYLDALRLLRFAQSRQIGLIHCSYQWLLPYAIFVGKRMDVPVILHIRRPGNSSKRLLDMGILRCSAVIAISRKIQSELAAIPGLANRIHLIPDAVDLSFFRPEAGNLRTELGIPRGCLLTGMVARVCTSKRQLDFVRAIGTLVARGHDVHAVVAGRVDDPDYAQALKDVISRQGLSDRCHLLGHRDDVDNVISSLDVLLSLAGGSVMYEAMACGKLVISAGFTRPEHSTHLIDGITGLVADSRDDETLTALLERAISDHALRQRLGTQAIEWARQNFSHATLAEKTQNLYRQVLRDFDKDRHHIGYRPVLFWRKTHARCSSV